MKNLFKILPVIALFITADCSSYNLYKPISNEAINKTATIAVVTGGNNAIDISLAEKTTRKIEEYTTFRAMSQDDITKRFPKYPANIMDFEIGKTDNFDKPWISDATMASIERIQKALDVDYILFVWTENTQQVETVETSRYGTSYSYNVSTATYTRLIQFPQKQMIGYSYFSWATPGQGNSSVESMLDEISDVIGYKISSKTGMGK